MDLSEFVQMVCPDLSEPMKDQDNE